MLPNNPRPSAGGLPGRPRQRSRSAGPSNRNASRYETQQPSNSAPRSRDPSRAPPLPTSRQAQAPRRGANTTYDEPRERPRQPPYRNSDDSTSSYTSSSTSSRSRGRTGYASSQTSWEDDKPSDAKGRSGSNYGDQRRRGYDTAPPSPREDDGDPQEGFGYAIWDRVANVASNLTVNVSKAWAVNIANEDGEATPEGQESRLTRAMKAYHIEKARDPSDLPAWLFGERERRVNGSTRGRRQEVDDELEPSGGASMPMPAQSGGLRAIYASAAAAAPVKKVWQDPVSYGETSSRAADRLKAQRDAKRGVSRATSPARQVPMEVPARMVSEGRPARVGLPSGPMGGRRR